MATGKTDIQELLPYPYRRGRTSQYIDVYMEYLSDGRRVPFMDMRAIAVLAGEKMRPRAVPPSVYHMVRMGVASKEGEFVTKPRSDTRVLFTTPENIIRHKFFMDNLKFLKEWNELSQALAKTEEPPPVAEYIKARRRAEGLGDL